MEDAELQPAAEDTSPVAVIERMPQSGRKDLRNEGRVLVPDLSAGP